MFCPSCGRETPDDRRFCSNCGTNLHVVKQALAGTFQPQYQLQAPDNELSDKNRKKFKSLGFLSIGFGILYAITMGIVSEIVREFSWEAGRIIENLIPICALFFVSGILLMLYGRMMYKRDNNAQVILVNPQTVSPPITGQIQSAPLNKGALPASELYPAEPYNYPPASVTERTTAQLKQPQPQSIRIKQ
jgi:hypothetical protein